MNNNPTHTAPVAIAEGAASEGWQRNISYFEMSTEEAIAFTSHGIKPTQSDFKGRAIGSKNKVKNIVK